MEENVKFIACILSQQMVKQYPDSGYTTGSVAIPVQCMMKDLAESQITFWAW